MPGFIDELGELDVVEFDLDYKGKKFHFKMQAINGMDDAKLVEKYIANVQKADISALWAERFSKCLLEPKLTMEEVGKLPKKILDGLQKEWRKQNIVNDEQAFLSI